MVPTYCLLEVPGVPPRYLILLLLPDAILPTFLYNNDWCGLLLRLISAYHGICDACSCYNLSPSLSVPATPTRYTLPGGGQQQNLQFRIYTIHSYPTFLLPTTHAFVVRRPPCSKLTWDDVPFCWHAAAGEYLPANACIAGSDDMMNVWIPAQEGMPAICFPTGEY